jgi:hypothetical protein
MKNRRKNLNIILITIIGIITLPGCDKHGAINPGFLEGIISIGPLCPVEQNPPDTSCLPTADTYKAYPVGIWTSKGNNMITLINPELDGSFKIKLDPGAYVVRQDYSQYGIGNSNLPVEIRIYPDEITSINIDIDTGIR